MIYTCGGRGDHGSKPRGEISWILSHFLLVVTRPEHLDIHARARMIYGVKRTQQGTSLLKIGWCLMRAMSLVARDCHNRILVDISHQDIWYEGRGSCV